MGLQRRINARNESSVFIGDIRGKGLFVGIELVRDFKTKEPAGRETEQIVNRLAQEPYRLLLSIDGPHHNVIKIKPPVCFTIRNAQTVIESMETVMCDRNTFQAR